jgi:hypothetical protein
MWYKKSLTMRNLLVYYLVIAIPLIALATLLFKGYKTVFFCGLIVYALLYRPLTDGFRLIALKKIEKQDLKKLFIPFWRLKWFKNLYFNI